MADRALIEAWAAMHRNALADFPAFRSGDAADAKLRREATETVCRGRLEGQFAVKHRGDHVEALFAAWPEPGSWYGAPVHTVRIAVDRASLDAPAWIVEQLRALPASALARADLMIYAAWRPVIDAVLAADLGLGVDAIVLLGDPQRALAALVDRYDPPLDLAAFGLTAGPLRDEAEADAIIDLARRVFTRWPDWCWFGATPAALARARTDLLLSLDVDSGTEHSAEHSSELGEVIRRDGKVVGHVGLGVETDHAFWGTLTGVDLLLAESEWGRGLVKTLYRRALVRMVERGVDVFKGGTSQPPVIGLARQMQRPLLAVLLRPGAPFAPAHFQGYL